jgi:APA family basic amino acid/polyamine antiporter
VTAPPSGRLLRAFGVGFGVAVIVGNTIGAGILRTPGEIAAQLPSPWLFFGVWLLGGAYAFVGSFSMAELGAAIPRAGGQYAFAHRALGPYAGFVVGWSDWVSTCGATAAVSLVIGEYTSELVPALSGRTRAVALGVTVGFALLQWRGVRWGGRTQEVTSLLKALAFAVLVAACFALGEGATATAAAVAVPTLAAFMIALQAVIFTYDGWAGVVYFSEEVRDPGRDVPRSLFLALGAIVAIYLLVNAALLYVLPLEALAGSPFAAGAAAEAIFGPEGGRVLLVLVTLSLLSNINAWQLMATRTLFALGRDGLFSRRAERVNEGGTPTVALAISTAVAVAFLLSGTFDQVIAVLAFFFVVNYTLTYVSLFVLRRREPDLPRPYRAWGYPWTTALALGGSAAFVVGAVAGDPRNSLYALGVLALSYPVYVAIGRATR